MKKINDILDKLFKKQEALLLIILAVMIFVFSLFNPNFIKSYNLLSMSQSLVPYAILTLGILFVIGTGNTDLSLGSICIASCAIAGKAYMIGAPLWTVLPIMLFVSLVFGAINGYLVSIRGIPSFIGTLGTMMFSRGISAIIVNDPNIFFPSGTWYNKLFSNYNGFPIGILWLILFVVITSIVIRKTKIGRYILAIGSNAEATRLSGVNTKLYLFIAYVICGLSAGIAGIFWSSSYATIATATGNGMEFDAMAAAFIGGTSAAGGSVAVMGSTIGMVMLTVIRSGLNFILSRFNINVNSTYVTYAVTGLIIVASILIDINNKKYSNSPKKKTKKNVIIATILAVVLVSSCVGYFLVNNKKEKTIAVISKGETAAFWIKAKEGCIQAGEEYGYKVTFRGPENESPSYLSQALSLAKTQLSDEPVGIGLAAICEGYVDILQEAYNSNIPVFQFDSGVLQADIDAVNKMGCNPIVGSVNTDAYAAAALAADHVYELIKQDIINSSEKYLIAVIQHNQSANAAERSRGFVEEIEKLANANPETKNKCEFYIEVKPDGLNDNYKLALESLTERGAKTIFMTACIVVEPVYDAILASGDRYNGINFAGFDTGTKYIEWLKNENAPKLLGAVAQNGKLMGYKIVENAIKAVNNEPFDENTYIDGVWYDATNVDELLEQGVVYEG